MQYVDSGLAAKANDNAVLHLAGTETVTGTKTFSAAPNVPAPVGTGDVTNKAYVDASIAAVGAGSYLATAGGSMTGRLTLSSNPTAPLQAAPKQYVDASVTVKADLVGGLVPTSELGSGTASGLNCLLGNGAWGPCGSSANATAIQSIPVAAGVPGNGQVLTYSSTSGQYTPSTPSGGAGSVTVTPAASQSIAQPQGTQFSVNNLSGFRYVTASDNWNASPSGGLTGGTQATVTLSPCPLGVDTSGLGRLFYWVLVVAMTASAIRLAAREPSASPSERPTSGASPKARAAAPMPRAASPSPQSGPAMTSVVDTVYQPFPSVVAPYLSFLPIKATKPSSRDATGPQLSHSLQNTKGALFGAPSVHVLLNSLPYIFRIAFRYG
jgi:hypothetical protein